MTNNNYNSAWKIVITVTKIKCDKGNNTSGGKALDGKSDYVGGARNRRNSIPRSAFFLICVITHLLAISLSSRTDRFRAAVRDAACITTPKCGTADAQFTLVQHHLKQADMRSGWRILYIRHVRKKRCADAEIDFKNKRFSVFFTVKDTKQVFRPTKSLQAKRYERCACFCC